MIRLLYVSSVSACLRPSAVRRARATIRSPARRSTSPLPRRPPSRPARRSRTRSTKRIHRLKSDRGGIAAPLLCRTDREPGGANGCKPVRVNHAPAVRPCCSRRPALLPHGRCLPARHAHKPVRLTEKPAQLVYNPPRAPTGRTRRLKQASRNFRRASPAMRMLWGSLCGPDAACPPARP